MASGIRNGFAQLKLTAALLVLVLFGGCGENTIIDVMALPCGTAEGTAASGTFTYHGTLNEDGCAGIASAELLVAGPQTVTVAHFGTDDPACPAGRLEMSFPAYQTESGTLPAFTLRGGLWSDGSFRIGNAVANAGATMRILMDGKYIPLEEGKPRQDNFSGLARVDVDKPDGPDPDCTYTVLFAGSRRQ